MSSIALVALLASACTVPASSSEVAETSRAHSDPPAQLPAPRAGAASAAAPNESVALTVYNQGFAVVRETFPLELAAGINDVRRSGTTAQLEPDSVILRDTSGANALRVLEQGYRNDPISQGLLLSLFEGREIEFEHVIQGSASPRALRIKGRVLRSGYDPLQARNGNYYGPQQPLIEVDGKLQFQLPGTPLFPSLGDDAILQPTLSWKIASAAAAKFQAELAYVTQGLAWHADYNLVAPANDENVDVVGWVTLRNDSGKRFDDARIKLMAGDVNRVQPPNRMEKLGYLAARSGIEADMSAQVVTEKSFDEYHLYTLANPTTIRDAESKQVEFVRSGGVRAAKLFVYDGAAGGQFWQGEIASAIQDPGYGTQANKKVWVMREFKNSEENRLGVPLPKGRLRFYQRDDDGQLEFLGENEIDHTPKDETVRVYVGNAFDVVGERTRTDFKIDSARDWMDESFELKLRNHKHTPVEVRVVEHLYRWTNWQIAQSSQPWTKKDSRTIEFRATIAPDAEATISYTAHYSW